MCPSVDAKTGHHRQYYRYGQRTVHLDGYVEVDAAYYSGAPPVNGQARFPFG